MAPDRQNEVDALYKKAQNILLHEMTEDEQSFVAGLAFDNHATLSDEKLYRLKELVGRKCQGPSEAA
jgi:phosphate uptake regulator